MQFLEETPFPHFLLPHDSCKYNTSVEKRSRKYTYLTLSLCLHHHPSRKTWGTLRTPDLTRRHFSTAARGMHTFYLPWWPLPPGRKAKQNTKFQVVTKTEAEGKYSNWDTCFGNKKCLGEEFPLLWRDFLSLSAKLKSEWYLTISKRAPMPTVLVTLPPQDSCHLPGPNCKIVNILLSLIQFLE